MNQLTIIGNLTRDPELRTTPAGKQVCNFSVAVNSRRRQDPNGPEDQPQREAIFFGVSAWNILAENCHRYLAKGRKVCVVGPVSLRTYTGRDGETHAQMEITANEVEFVSSPHTDAAPASAPETPAPSGYVEVNDGELPF